MSLAAHPRIADWITLRAGRVQIHTGKVDIGQRVSTALVQIAHEELSLPLDQIDIAEVRTGAAPDEGMTSGSNSIEQSGNAVRRAAATLRGIVRQSLVARLGGAAEAWVLEDGVFHLAGTNHRVPIVDLIGDVALDTLVDSQAAPRPRATVPSPQMRGIADMVRGGFRYIQDWDAPGLLHARVVRPPHVQARLRDCDDATVARLTAKGLSVIEDGSFLAVVGAQEWATVTAAQALARACDWDPGPGLPEMDVFAQLNAARARRFAAPNSAPTEGPIPAALPDPDHAARYERPYQLHGPLAPSAALAQWRAGQLTLHCQSQGIYPLRASIADSLGLEEAKVDIHFVPGSGCYGHTGADDAAYEAALIAVAMPGPPILLKWTRADEHGWEPFAPAMAVDLAAKLTDGRITQVSAEVFSDTHRGRPRPGPNRAGPRKLLANRFRANPIPPQPAEPNMGVHAGMHRNLDPVYGFDQTRLVKNLVPDLPHRTSAMRCLGGAVNVFAIECFMDDLARQAGTDPIAFRISHLTDPRAMAVLEELDRQLAQWPDVTMPMGRGIAYGQYKNRMTRVAVAVDLEVSDLAEIHLRRAAIVAEAGRIIDAGGLTAQLEGGFVQAASWALYEEVKWDRDGILTRDWDSYPVIRFDNIPDIAVTLMDRPDDPSLGAGEAAPGPTLGAIGNAVLGATGLRMHRLPFTPWALQQAAYG